MMTFKWNAIGLEFCAELTKITWFKGYNAACSLSMKTFGGAPTEDITKAADFTWTATIPKYRGTVFPKRIFNKISYSDKVGQFKQTTIAPHSDPISGTFTLSIGGVPIMMKDGTGARTLTGIPFDVSALLFRDAIR